MMLKTQSAPHRLASANAPRLRRLGRVADWGLSIVFAGLLGVAVWRLDHGGAGSVVDVPGGPAASAGWTDRAGAVARSLLETLIVRDVAPTGLSAGQVPPEGWPLWSGEPATRSVASNCPRDGLPSSGPARCE